MDRQSYRNHGGNSGVRYYAFGSGSIRIWFKDGEGYEYDDTRPGREHVDAMKHLAEQGQGLATYINQHVRWNFARKL